MKPSSSSSSLLLLLLTSTAAMGASAKLKPAPKMLLSKIDTLTLRSDSMTKSRRVESIPQLKCVGGDGKGRYEIDVMRCKSQGSDYGDEDIAWACTANLPREFKLGATDVICEGYDSPNDDYVLKGSCGVEYRLALTDYGYEKFGHSSIFSPSSSINWSAGPFWLLFIGVFLWILYSASTAAARRPPRPAAGNGRPWFWGGGGGGGGGGDPPPPYDSQPPRKPPGTGSGSGAGFWTGAAAGAAASAAGSYLMGGGRGRRDQAYTGGGGGGGYTMGQGYAGPSRSSSSSSSAGSGGGSGGGGGERHASTGFGQTRRR